MTLGFLVLYELKWECKRVVWVDSSLAQQNLRFLPKLSPGFNDRGSGCVQLLPLFQPEGPCGLTCFFTWSSYIIKYENRILKRKKNLISHKFKNIQVLRREKFSCWISWWNSNSYQHGSANISSCNIPTICAIGIFAHGYSLKHFFVPNKGIMQKNSSVTTTKRKVKNDMT